ncbi:MAG: DotA/TraY family protein [Alcanivorax sp.]
MAITTTNFAKYTVLPGIWPRIKDLLSSSFSFLASVIAVLYFNMGLLPKSHPYLDNKNYGRFGVRHVIAEAGKNLTFSRQHTDQIIIYFVVLIGLVILALQILLLGASFFSNPVFAGATNWFDSFAVSWSNYFVNTPFGPSQDIALIVLDKVFGAMQFSATGSTQGFFGSCVSDLVTPCTDIRGNTVYSPTVFPTPFHLALHQMLATYTLGIGFIAGLIIIYHVIAIVGETATSGTPFGRRTNKAWFIPRLIVFFALLAPITLSGGNNDGLNVAQLITLSVAKFGSNMATNAWLGFLGQVTMTGPSFTLAGFLGVGDTSGNEQYMLSVPNLPEMGNLAQFMYIVRMCMYAEGIINGLEVNPYIVRPHSSDTTSVTLLDGSTANYNAMGGTTDDYLLYYDSSSLPIDFIEAVEFSRYQDVVLRFGHRNPPGGTITNLNNPPDAYDDEWGHVEPTCGEIKFEVTSLDPFVIGPPPNGPAEYAVQQNYWYFVDQFLFWDDVFEYVPYCMLQALLPYDHDTTCLDQPIPGTPGVYTSGATALPGGATMNFPPNLNNTQWLTVDVARTTMELSNAMNKAIMLGQQMDWNSASPIGALTGSIDQNFLQYYNDPAYNNSLALTPLLQERGWAGAALWYNKLAELNGIYGAAMQNIPRPYKYPKVMEQVAAQHNADDANAAYSARFNPRLSNGELADLPRPGDQYIAAALYSTYQFWNSSAVQETTFTRRSNNAIIDAINMLFGTHGIFDIVENRGVYPLAMLSGLGKSMVDAALRNMFAGIVGQGIGQTMDNFFGSLGNIAGGFAFRMGMIGMSIGFVLYYVLPFMPFIYFFFAFSGWIKSIFEAVLAMPLWALAHIKLDGEGLPGPWATNGYFLLFEIFLRPLLIIFGFVFSITVYAALVDTLHNSYHLLTFVAGGYDIETEINSGAIREVSWWSTLLTTNAGVGASNTAAFMRGPLDELFYSVIYVIMVYMIGLSCFKLVDAIPNNIMRWMGVTVSTFHETAGDPASELAGKMYRGTNMTNAQIRAMLDRNSNAAIDAHLQNSLSR